MGGTDISIGALFYQESNNIHIQLFPDVSIADTFQQKITPKEGFLPTLDSVALLKTLPYSKERQKR